ncbi:MAG: DUF932 domain-containing protein [Steroidobacteraceae bacterium]|jgi:hypothetical protein|nr:DUF932 domain-containing protein [Steroidobacteraceae bacterium]
MNANSTSLSFASHAHAFSRPLSIDTLRAQVPAVFAPAAHERLSEKYTFIPTERVLTGLMNVGFVPVEARQTQSRYASPLHARHLLRLRRRFETVQLEDSIPEIVFLNSHDGTSAYQLRMGLFRVVCTNGLIVSQGAFPALRVNHRGNVVDEVIAGALEMAERFEALAAQVQQMQRRRLHEVEQIHFAGRAPALRFADVADAGMPPSALLNARRIEDMGDSLWAVLNRVQENLLRGGLSRRSATGRLTRTRRIRSIREDVRLNGGLWNLAAQVLVA